MPEHFQIKNNDFSLSAWYLSEISENEFDANFLDAFEKVKFEKIGNELMRKSFLAIRAMNEAGKYGKIHYGNSGKPFSETGFISISHSGNWLALMHSKNKEVGVDVEQIRERILKIKTRFLSESELILAENNLEKLTLFWSAKEAAFKKFGGNTVFFKAHQEIKSVDEKNGIIRMIVCKEKTKTETELFFMKPDAMSVLVHTL